MELDGGLDDALSKTRELVMSYKNLGKSQEEMEKRVREEADAHERTKAAALAADRAAVERLTAAEDERMRVKAALDQVQAAHNDVQARFETEQAAHTTTRSIAAETIEKEKAAHLNTQAVVKQLQDELAGLRRTNERLVAEAEAQREAFAANVRGHEDRHANLQTTLAASQEEASAWKDQHGSAKAELAAALQAQDAYRKEYHATFQELQTTKRDIEEFEKRASMPDPMVPELQAQVEALCRARDEAILAKQESEAKEKTAQIRESQYENELEAVRQAAQEKDNEIQKIRQELDDTKRKAREICMLVGQASPRGS